MGFLFPAILLAPYFILLANGFQIQKLDWSEIFWALRNSGIQSLASAIFSVALGLVFALGLNRIDLVNRRLSSVARILLVLPCLMPPFFVLLTTLSWVDPFPFGLVGITIVHVFQYAGLVGVTLAGVLVDRVASVAEVSSTLGIGRLQFFRMAWPMIQRDVVTQGLFVFIMSFSSFSIPLVIGGGRGTTLEILIFEKIRVSNEVGAAVAMSLLQTLILGFLLWRLPQQVQLSGRPRPSAALISSSVGTGLIVVFSFFLIFPWIVHVPLGFAQLSSLPHIGQTLVEATGHSLFYSAIISFMILLFLLAISYVRQDSRLSAFLRVYFPPSVSLIGISGLLILGYVSETVAYLFCFFVLLAPMICRFGFENRIVALDRQVHVAVVMGADRRSIWRKIILPQVWPHMIFLFGLAFLWSFGDFAMAKFFLPSGSTLPLLVENLMTSYRINSAMTVGALVLVISGIVMSFSWRLSRVFD